MVGPFYPREIEARIAQHKTFINFFRYQCKKQPESIFIRYITGKGDFALLTYSEVNRISSYLAHQWAHFDQESIVSFLGVSGVDYLLTILALLKLNITAMLISPRNSDKANINLLNDTGSKYLLVTPQYYEKAIAIIKNTDIQVTQIEPFDLEELKYISDKDDDDIAFVVEDIDKPTLIIHSSGTTRFPKAIYLNNSYLFYCTLFSEAFREHGSNVMTKDDVLFACVPLFHTMGLIYLSTCICNGASMIFMEKAINSQQEISRALKINRVTVIMVPPIILEEMIPFLSQSGENLAVIQNLKYVIYGGAPLKKEIGHWFHQNKINIRNGLGSSETGPIMSAKMAKTDNWYGLGPFITDVHGDPYVFFEDTNIQGQFHLVVRKGCPSLAMNVSNRTDGGYDTNDLYSPDPEYPGYYNYMGRKDDLLVLENGEKTNVVAIEARIRNCPFVKQVIVFGSGRQCTMALIEVNMEYAVCYGPEEIVKEIKKTVELSNNDSPNYAKILPQMIKILPFNASLPHTDKGTIMRQAAYKMYRKTVDAVYENFIQNPVEKSEQLTYQNEVTLFLRQSLAVVLNQHPADLDPKRSVFEMGLNSLMAIQLRHLLVKRFGPLAQNFVYQQPTLDLMRDCILQGPTKDLSRALTQVLADYYIERAKNDFSALSRPRKTQCQTVLLTGATGSLGAFILRDLLKSNVKKVYCMVRGDNREQRLFKAFTSRYIDPMVLDTPRLEILPMQLDEPYLGLGNARYYELKEEVDTIQHCGWTLDFNMNVSYFEKACIAPFYNLVHFAYKENPMHIHFISSVSAHPVMDMGYAQSKHIVERLLIYLRDEKNMPCTIERVGQVCGSSVHGVWNTSEQFPLMIVGGAGIMKKMPRMDILVDWIPVDFASAAIVNIMLSPENTCSVCPIVGTQVQLWSNVLQSVAACGLEFEIVSPEEWIQSLSEDSTNPAYRLISHFEALFKTQLPISEIQDTCAGAAVLNSVPKIDARMMKKYICHWRSIGFYSP